MCRDGPWLLGTVVASMYPAHQSSSTALVRIDREGHYRILIDASGIGTRAWTVLTQIAADALEVPLERVHIEIGNSAVPRAPSAGARWGTRHGGRQSLKRHGISARLHDKYCGVVPAEGLESDRIGRGKS